MLKKLFNLLLILLTISLVNGGNLFPRRSLAEKEIQLNSKPHLKFNDDSKWEFEVDYTSTEGFIKDSTEYLSILFNTEASKAACKVISNTKLSCIVEAGSQTKADLVQLNPELSEGATIKFNNLEEITDMYIETKLNYQDSYSLTYDNNDNNKWEFRIKLIQTDTLPENGLVLVDVFFSSNKAILVDCKHKQHFLYCESSARHEATFLFQISPIKKDGTVEWENILRNMTIPLYSELTIYSGGLDLELIDRRWNYVLVCRGANLGDVSTLITLNTKILKKVDNKEYYYLTRCYSKSSGQGVYFNCIVGGDNHEITDLVYISPKDDINDISINWKNRLTSDDIIIRKAELTFVSTYDLIYSKGWTFKIRVKDDENLPENAKVNIDLVDGANNGVSECTCSFKEHILTCTSSKSSSSMIRLQAEKEKGSVVWNGIKEKRVPIPLNYSLTFKDAFGAFFTDKWNFLIKASYISTPPVNSTAVIDILHNENKTTATCIIGSVANNVGYIYCVSDKPTQTATDTIKINPEKLYGSLEWGSSLSDYKGTLLASEVSEVSENKFTFYDANNMYFSGNKWHFNIQGKSTDSSNTFGIYKVDIKIKRYTGISENGIAKCLLYTDNGGIYLKMICSCEYDNQNKDDLIKIAYEKTESSTIKWKSGITSDYSITLNAALTFKVANKLKKSSSNTYTFQINLEEDNDAILPLDSKLIVDVKHYTFGVAECTSDTKTLISCTVKDYTGASEPSLKYYKSEKGSVIWKNENRQDYVIILESANLELLSANYLYFIDGKWHFQIKQKSVTIGSVIMDVSYGDEKTSATCTGINNNLMNCVLKDQNQDKMKLVRLKKIQSSGSVIKWTNLNVDTDIPLKTELTFKSATNLKVIDNDGGKTWVFDVVIIDEDIPENALVIVDIYIISPTKTVKSIANCYHKNKILKCTVLSKDYDNNYNYLYLIKDKEPNSISTVTKWNNMEKMITLISSDTVYNLDYKYATKIIDESGQKVFYIEISKTTPLEVDQTANIDILIDTVPKLSQCKALSTTKLRCQIASSEVITNKKIYIANTSTSSSTIRWINLDENQILTPIQLTFKKIYDINSVNEHEYKFKIEVEGTDLKNNLILPVEIYHIINGKKAEETQTENKEIIPCKSNNNALLCNWISESIVINPENDLIQLMLKESGEIIEWTNPGKYDVNTESNPTEKENEPTSPDKENEDNPKDNDDKGNKKSYGNYLKIVKTYLIFILGLI